MPKIPVDPQNIESRETTLFKELQNIRSVFPWMWCVEFLDEVREIQRVVANTEAVEWDGVTFQPYPFHVDKIPSTSTGEFPTTRLAFFNTSSLVHAIENGNGYINKNLVLYILNARTLKQFNGGNVDDYTRNEYPYQFLFKVKGASINNDIILLDLGTPGYLNSKLPARLYIRDFCPFTFQGEHCWLQGIFDDIKQADLASGLNMLSDPKYNDCMKLYEFCKQYWKSATLTKEKGYHSHELPKGVAFGGYPTVARGDLNYY